MADPKRAVTDTDAAVRDMYNRLAGTVQAGGRAVDSVFAQGQQRTGQIYDQMTDTLQRQADATSSGLAGQLSMLGIGDATDAATQNLRGQLNQSLVSAARRRAAELSGLSSQRTGYRTASREAVTNTQREGVQKRADIRTILEEAVTNLQAAEAEARGQIELEKLRGEVELQQMRQQMAARRGGSGGGRGSPLDLLRAQLMGLEIMEKQQELNMGPDTSFGSGQGQLNQFLGGPSDYWANQAGPKFRAALSDIIDFGNAQATGPGAAINRDPYAWASQNATSYGNLNQDALRQALQIYFG